MIYTGAKRKPWHYNPLVPKSEVREGDVWAGDGRDRSTALPTGDMSDKVLLLERGGEWVWWDDDTL